MRHQPRPRLISVISTSDKGQPRPGRIRHISAGGDPISIQPRPPRPNPVPTPSRRGLAVTPSPRPTLYLGGTGDGVPRGPSPGGVWRLVAPCRGTPTWWWFADLRRPYSEARKMCAECPVRRECLDDELDVMQRGIASNGYRGGMMPAERWALLDEGIRRRRDRRFK